MWAGKQNCGEELRGERTALPPPGWAKAIAPARPQRAGVAASHALASQWGTPQHLLLAAALALLGSKLCLWGVGKNPAPRPVQPRVPPAPRPVQPRVPPAPRPVQPRVPPAPRPVQPRVPPAPRPVQPRVPPAPRPVQPRVPPAPRPVQPRVPPAPRPVQPRVPPAPRPVQPRVPPAPRPVQPRVPPAPRPVQPRVPPAPRPVQPRVPPAPRPVQPRVPPAPRPVQPRVLPVPGQAQREEQSKQPAIPAHFLQLVAQTRVAVCPAQQALLALSPTSCASSRCFCPLPRPLAGRATGCLRSAAFGASQINSPQWRGMELLWSQQDVGWWTEGSCAGEWGGFVETPNMLSTHLHCSARCHS
ncbi:uncharacterized protein LOC142825325 [Pelodiscus sinensis]|uniref:uncharacterized protein LOC142825325 n=1 Tax=Pelodiscus sinensis TaxID=13735 RepID=UPI003F6D59FF